MSDEELSWDLKFKDFMSGPMAKIEERIGGLEKAMGSLDGTSDRAAKGLGKGLSGAGIDRALGLAKAKIIGARGDFAQAWRGLTTIAAPATDKLGGFFSPLIGKMMGGLGRGRGLLSGVMGKMLGSLGGAGGGIWGSLTGGLSKVGGKLAGFGRSAMTVLGPLGAGFGKLFGATGDLARAIGGKLGPAFKQLGSAGMAGAGFLGASALAMGAGALAIGAAAGKWAIGSLQFKEDTLNAFKTMLGTQSAAERVFKQATKFAATTPFSSEEVVSGFQSFLTAGFKEDQLDTLMKAVGDVGANMGTEKMEQVIRAMGQIKAKGKLQGEEMMQLAEAGVGQTAILDALQTINGKSKGEVQALMSAGKISGEQGIEAILKAIETTQSGGKLGSAMQGKSQTLTGLFSSFMDIPSTLLFASDSLKALDPLKAMVSAVIAMFDEGKPLFKQGVAMFDRVSAAWGKAFGAMGKADLEDILSNVIGAIESFGVTAAPFAAGFFPELMNQLGLLFGVFNDPNASPEELQKKGQQVAQALGMVATGIVTLGTWAAWLADKFVWFFDQMGSLTGRIFGGGASDEAEQASLDEYNQKMAELRAYKASRAGGDFAAGGAAGAPPNVSTTVGNITVQVAPGEQNAGLKVASQIQSQMPATLSNYATEMGG